MEVFFFVSDRWSVILPVERSVHCIYVEQRRRKMDDLERGEPEIERV